MPKAADTVIKDVLQLLHHIVLPHGGTFSDLIAIIPDRLSHYTDRRINKKMKNKHKDNQAKDHERMKGAGEVIN